MKTLTILALICSIVCMAMSLIEHDYTEAMAWFIVVLHNSKELILNK